MQWPLPCDRLLKTKLPHWSSILFMAGHARAWSVAWHSWGGRLENNDSAACPPAARRTGTRMSKREVFKCLNITRASGPINVESAMIHCDTISSAAANWKANRWAWACGNDKTHVMTEHGCALDGTQWAGERSPASGSPAAKMCPATEHSTASSEFVLGSHCQHKGCYTSQGNLQLVPVGLNPGPFFNKRQRGKHHVIQFAKIAHG